MSSTSLDLTSRPFKSLEELYSNLNNLNPWPEVKKRQKNTRYVYSGKNINDVKKPLIKFEKNNRPKTLVCHDMKGGYLDDRFINGSDAHDSYIFYHWSAVDTFVYFSHYFVTIPPYGWINAAHIHGVKILGTIITEWEGGVKIWKEVFASDDETKRFADALVTVAKFYKFDGWLLNVENKIDRHEVEKLKFFVRYLTQEIHKAIDGAEIIWYDSVTDEGTLSWQNQLNDRNKCFFDSCDGIFLNYNWTESGLAQSCAIAKDENRVRDVYVGVDVWGRGCPGGGGFHSDYALKKIKEHDLSVAIFGPGWTHEHFGAKTFEDVENLFWAQLFPYLYVHVPLYDNEIFRTSFCRGAGLNNYHLGQRQIGNYIGEDWFGKNVPFYNLSAQCCQLSVPTPHLEFLTEEEEEEEKEGETLPASNSSERNDTERAIELLLNSKSETKREIKDYETKKCIVKVRGNTVLFQSKPQSLNLNYFQFYHRCSFNGGGCLELITKNPDLYHRLFLIEVTFKHGIQVSLVYRMDKREPEQSEPLLVIENEGDVKLIRKYKTEELEFPWRRNLYLTDFDKITGIGAAAPKEGIITLGEIVVEEKETDKNQIVYYLSNTIPPYVYVMRSASFVYVVKANGFNVVDNIRGGYCLELNRQYIITKIMSRSLRSNNSILDRILLNLKKVQ